MSSLIWLSTVHAVLLKTVITLVWKGPETLLVLTPTARCRRGKGICPFTSLCSLLQRRHALRCYCQAMQVYKAKGWSLAEDHINFTIGRQSFTLRQPENAVAAFRHILINDSKQAASQQGAFLREYLYVYKVRLGLASAATCPAGHFFFFLFLAWEEPYKLAEMGTQSDSAKIFGGALTFGVCTRCVLS